MLQRIMETFFKILFLSIVESKIACAYARGNCFENLEFRALRALCLGNFEILKLGKIENMEMSETKLWVCKQLQIVT